MTTGISLGTSGLDIDTLVTNSVQTYQTKYDKATQTQQTTEWTKSAYADIYADLATFETAASNYKLSSSTVSKTATSTSTAITAIANAEATDMSHDVSVSTLATSAYLQTNNGQKVSVTVAGKTSTNLADVAGIDLTTGVATDTALSFTLNDGTSSKTISYTYAQLKGSTDANGKVTAPKTLTDLASDIKNSGLKISAAYDSVADSFSLYNSSTGADNKIQITTSANTAGTNAKTLFNNFNLASYNSSTKTLTAVDTTALYGTGITGTNAAYTVDGKTYSSDSNTDQISGVTYTFNDTTAANAKVSVSTNASTLITNVQAFVTSYNTLLSAVNTQLNASKNSNYTPLTDAQKAKMTDTQISQWETQAKVGLLSKDPILSNIVSTMRNAVSNPVNSVSGKYTTLASLGVTTGDWTESGTLHVDTSALQKAITADPNCVYKVFSTKGTDDSTNGIAYRLYNISSTSLQTLTTKAGTSAAISDVSTLGKQISTMATNIKTLQKTLSDKEDYFYTKYHNMEDAMSKFSSSISSLTSSLK